jgi:hypothetical protein
MKKTIQSSKKIALSGMLSALNILIMFFGSIYQTLDLTTAAAASLTVVFAMVELGTSYAVSVYAVTSILAVVLLPNKSPAIIFAVFAGLYPILKAYLQRIRFKWLAFVAKLAVFNLFFTAIIAVGKYLLMLEEEFYAFGWVIYVLGNVTFVLYDFALDRLILLYVVKIKKIFDRTFKLH